MSSLRLDPHQMRTGLVPNTTRSIVLPICRRCGNSCQTTSKNKTDSYAEMPVKWLHIRVSLPLLSLSVVHTSLLLPSASASDMSVSVLVTQFFCYCIRTHPTLAASTTALCLRACRACVLVSCLLISKWRRQSHTTLPIKRRVSVGTCCAWVCE